MTKWSFSICFMLGCFIISAGCTVQTRTVDPDEKVLYDAGYTFSDKKMIVSSLVASLLAKPPLSTAMDKPILVVYTVSNQTSEHISTTAITDDIRQELLASGKVRFVNRIQRDNIEKESQYQYGGRVAPETRIALGRQSGARYMLTGTLRSMEKKQPTQVRIKKKFLQYYSLNLELTDLETSLIEWADSTEIIREASEPIIGW